MKCKNTISDGTLFNIHGVFHFATVDQSLQYLNMKDNELYKISDNPSRECALQTGVHISTLVVCFSLPVLPSSGNKEYTSNRRLLLLPPVYIVPIRKIAIYICTETIRSFICVDPLQDKNPLTCNGSNRDADSCLDMLFAILCVRSSL
jgi:hypothetical protein